MSDILYREISARVDSFVAEVTSLARKAALEILESGLTTQGRGTMKGGLTSPRVRRKSGKRSPEEIQDAANTLLEYIRENPGQRMEAIAKAMGSTTRELTLPTKKLLQQNLIKIEGQKRATAYYPATGKTVKSKRRAGGGRRKKA